METAPSVVQLQRGYNTLRRLKAGCHVFIPPLIGIVLHTIIVHDLRKYFSAPEAKAQVYYCDHTLSVVRPSPLRPSLTFTFSTLSSNCLTDFNET